jgi:cysteinyl-tRNA synthetase
VSELRFFNTLGRAKQVFESLDAKPGPVRIYSCGPTVYGRQHIGNMRPYVFADLLKRTLRLFGYDVKHVINVTDVGHLTDDADRGDDKMELAAQKSGESPWEIAKRYTELWERDLETLGVAKPDVLCRATDHIPQQIAMIQRLEERGFTYQIRDGVYFDTARAPHYGELCGGIAADDQQAQERIEAAAEKRNPCDFALWKLSPPDGARRQMEWDSPWGRGFPGWHIECSAMSAEYLGVPFDIHTGGIDHVPVHHTNEIVQSECATGVRPSVRYWMHNGWLMIDGGKMAKSAGNIVTLDHLAEERIQPLAFRYFLLSAHYRQQMNFNEEAIRGAQAAYERLARHAEKLREAGQAAETPLAAEYRERFKAALGDDLNAPQALAVTWEMVRSAELADGEKWRLLCDFDASLGLDLRNARVTTTAGAGSEADARIAALVRERDQARKARNFARADEIRKQLSGEGIVLEDSRDGETRWRRG